MLTTSAQFILLISNRISTFQGIVIIFITIGSNGITLLTYPLFFVFSINCQKSIRIKKDMTYNNST